MSFLKFDRTLSKRILTLAYPVTIAMLTQTAINLVDTIMVGRLPAEYSIAGQGAIMISLILLWAVGGLISSMGVGTQAVSARRYGEGKAEDAGAVLNNAAFVAGIVSLIATAAVLVALPSFFPYLHPSDAVVKFGVEYSTYRLLGVFSMVLTIVYKGFFDGIGETKVHMKAAIAMNVVNIILNYCLIFGVGPFPQLYVAGAGIASLIATFIGLAIMIFYSSRKPVRARFGLYKRGTLDRTVSWGVVKVGIPGGLATVFLMTGFAMFTVIVGWLDEATVNAAIHALPTYASMNVQMFALDASAVWTPEVHRLVVEANPPVFTAATKLIMDIMMACAMTCMAFGQATATLVGQSLGAKDYDLAERYGWESIKLGAGIMGVISVLLIAFPESAAGWFNPDPAVISASRTALMLMACSAPVIAVGMILMQSLFGAGMTVYVMVVEMILHFFCLVPAAWLFGIRLDWGLVGIWGAALVYSVLLASAMVWKFRGGTWKYNKI